MKYKCVWSKFVTTVTVVVLVVLAFAIYKLHETEHTAISYLLIAVILGSLAYAPLYIEVTVDSLIVKRVFGSLVIPRSNIVSIGLYTSRFGVRKFGSGGLFGYLGWFWTSEVGNYFSYSTDENSQILIVTPTRKYVISCEKREELLRNFV